MSMIIASLFSRFLNDGCCLKGEQGIASVNTGWLTVDLKGSYR